jgi:peptidoglycan/xylan/chitin deacetylase (PgdA/CDA1 family)
VSDRDLQLGPSTVAVAKAGMTRARSLIWKRRGAKAAPGVRILFYHRIADEPDSLAVRPHAFRRQVEYLAAQGFRIVDVPEAARLAASGETGRVVGMSFDDGYRDVIENGRAVLEQHDATVTVFVVPGVIDGTARFTWYDRQPPVLGWDEITDLDRGSPFRFEPHTLTHPNLLALPEQEARSEIAGSRDRVAERLGRPAEAFCYPAGLYTDRERSLVADAGFSAAVTCDPGANGPATDPLLLHRTAVELRDGLVDFAAKVAGAHDTPLPLRSAYRRVRYGRAGA